MAFQDLTEQAQKHTDIFLPEEFDLIVPLKSAELFVRVRPCLAPLIFLLYLSRNMNFAQMEKRLGGISASAFSRNKVRLSEKIEKDPYLRFRFKKIKNALSGF